MLTRGSALSYVSSLALLGLVLSVAVLILVLSVVNGFERELRGRILGLLPHVTATAYEPLREAELEELDHIPLPDQVVGFAPYVQGTVLLAANDRIEGAQLTGVQPDRYRRVALLEPYLRTRTLDTLDQQAFSIILGQRLADSLEIGIGDQVMVILPGGSVSPAGAIPRQRRFTVVDILSSSSQLDSQAAFAGIADAQKFFRTGSGFHGVHVRVKDVFELDEAVSFLQMQWGPHRVRITSWMRTFGNLYQAIAVQKLTMFILLSFLVGVAAFNLVSGLMMIVEQRRHDIAVLRTIGATSATVIAVFGLLGLLLALAGILLGLLTGGLLAAFLPAFFAWITETFTLDLMTQYFISYLPTDLRIPDFLNVGSAAFVLAICAAIYPAWKASRLLPSRVLAHE